MESQQSEMLQNPSDVAVHVNSKSGSSSDVQNSSNSTWDFGVQNRNKTTPLSKNSDEVIGVVEVFIHQARDIHNICIYHKQDVYAKLCLTSDPDTTVSTQIVNGGGKNPVFNENLSLNVQTVDSSVKCEIWMLSRVRNYLEDQLLGFALVPISDVLKSNGGKLSQEYTLSSTDLFHSPAGFVELSLSYIGSCPDVLEIPAPHLTTTVNGNGTTLSSPNEELEKLEFPDPDLLNENELMVSEYYELTCNDPLRQNSFDEETKDKCAQEKSVNFAPVVAVASSNGGGNIGEHPVHAVASFNGENNIGKHPVHAVASFTGESNIGKLPVHASFNRENNIREHPVQAVAGFNKESNIEKHSVHAVRTKTITSSVSTNESPAQSTNESASSHSVHSTNKLPNNALDTATGETESNSSNFAKLAVSVPVPIEPDQKVMQQDYVDMYLKSMQQFTDSLAKMKLPIETENNSSGSVTADSNSPSSNGNKGQKVFYGSRAFF